MKADVRVLALALILIFRARSSFGAVPEQKAVPYFQVTDEIVLEKIGIRMAYAAFVPKSYQPGTPTPLILALHFGGTVTPTYGRDFADLLVRPALSELEAIIVAPNCPGRGWRDPMSETAVLKLMEIVAKRFTVDGKRIVVTGFSMGAVGTFFMAAKHPEIFSAAVVVSGIPNENDISGLKGVPFYIIHSAGDEVFPIEDARAAFGKLRTQGVPFELDIVQDISHYRTVEFVPALRKAAPWIRKIWELRE